MKELEFSRKGSFYLEKGKTEEAMEMFQRALDINESNEEAHQGLGFIYHRKKQYDKAIEEFRRTLSINPSSSGAYRGLGFIYLSKGDPVSAEDNFRRSLEIEPSSSHTRRGLGQTFKMQGKPSLAVEEFKAAVSANPREKDILEDLGALYLEMKDYHNARDIFEKVRDLGEKDDITVSRRLSEIYQNTGKMPLAVQSLINISEYQSLNPVRRFIGDQKSYRVKIIRTPFFESDLGSTELNTTLIPALAVGQITAYLKRAGLDVDQDDLNIKVHHDNCYSDDPEKKIDEKLFINEERVLRYIEGHEDEDIEGAMGRAGKKTRLDGYRMILFSIPQCISNRSDVMFALCLSKYLKKKYGVYIIAGGWGAKLAVNYEKRDIDLIVIGDNGCAALADLIGSIMEKGELPVNEKIRYSEDRKVAYSSHYPDLILPDFRQLPRDLYVYRTSLDRYEGEVADLLERCNKNRVTIFPFKFSAGCPGRCAFCSASIPPLSFVLSPKRAVSYLNILKERHDPTGFFFLSETLNITRDYIEEICDEIIRNKLNILWTDSARPDNLDRDLIMKMREAGCIRIIYGMETASPRLQKYIHKGINLDKVEKILKWTHEAGIWIGLETITGLPYETEEDFNATYDFLKRNIEYIDRSYLNAFHIEDSSHFLLEPAKYGLENISEINACRDYEEYQSYVKYRFDEKNGMKWDEKKEWIFNSFLRLVEIGAGEIMPFVEEEHLLFFLYREYNDKSRVRDMFMKIGKQKTIVFEEKSLDRELELSKI